MATKAPVVTQSLSRTRDEESQMISRHPHRNPPPIRSDVDTVTKTRRRSGAKSRNVAVYLTSLFHHRTPRYADALLGNGRAVMRRRKQPHQQLRQHDNVLFPLIYRTEWTGSGNSSSSMQLKIRWKQHNNNHQQQQSTHII